MKSLQALVDYQQVQIAALKKRAAGQTLDKIETTIVELTLIGRQAPKLVQERADFKIIDLSTAGKSPVQTQERADFKLIELTTAGKALKQNG